MAVAVLLELLDRTAQAFSRGSQRRGHPGRPLPFESPRKDADNSARKVTEPQHYERPWNRRGSRGGQDKDKGGDAKKGDKARKGGEGKAARSGSQERGKPRGGAESAPRAEK